MRLYFQQVRAIIIKDILVELRTREASTAMLVFAVMSIILFNFALRLRVDSLKPLVPGILWVILVYAGTLGLGHSMSIEQINQCIDGLLLTPSDRSVIFVGKAVSNVLFTLLISLVVVPVLAILLDESLLQPGVILTVIVGVIGYSGAGTLISVPGLVTLNTVPATRLVAGIRAITGAAFCGSTRYFKSPATQLAQSTVSLASSQVEAAST